MEEVMNYEEVMEPEVEVIEAEEGKTGIGTGTAMLIGAGVAIAATAVVKLVKKGIAAYKAKKAVHLVDDNNPVEVTDEQIMEITK